MRSAIIFRGIVSTMLSFFLFSNVAPAQGRIEIAGRVVDANGSAIAGAEISVGAVSGSVRRTLETDSDGGFRVSDLAVGRYTVTAKARGFATAAVVSDGSAPLTVELQAASIAEIVSVTSSYLAGTAEALEQTAGAVQTIGRNELERARIFDFSEALRKIPGVVARDEEGFGLRPNIGIRGTNPTRSSKVLLLEDGIPLAYAPYGDNASYYHPPIERFESVEVQKGSGQIVYGPVTVAGLVNYITPNPPEKTSLSVKLVGGNRDFLSGNAMFGGTWGRTGLIVNVNRKQGAGSRENVRSGLTDLSSKVVRTLNAANVLTGKFSVFAEDSQVTYSGLTEAEYRADPRQNPFGNDRFSGRRVGFSLQHVAVLTSNLDLTTNFYSNSFSRDWWRQSSNSVQRPNRLNLDPDCRSMADLYTTCGNEGRLRDYANWGIEPKLAARFKTGKLRNDLAAGFRFTRENQDRLQINGDLPSSRDGAIVESNVRRNQAVSAFAQNRIVFGDLAVSAGVRLETIGFERLNRLNQATGRTAMTEIIPGIGAVYNLFRNTSVFAGLHRGFAPPRTEDIISNTGGVVEIDAERSWNYEIGFRSRPMRAVALEATYFRTDYENQIVPASVVGGVGSAFTNGGRTRHQGFEISGRIDSSKIFGTAYNLYLQGSSTILSTAEFRGVRFSSVAGFSSVSVSGNRLPYAPRTTSNLSLGYSFKNLDGFVETNFIGRQFADDLNSVDPVANGQRGALAAQTYVNATLNYRVEKLRSVFFLTVKNILDRTFVVDRSRGMLPSSGRLVQTGIRISF